MLAGKGNNCDEASRMLTTIWSPFTGELVALKPEKEGTAVLGDRGHKAKVVIKGQHMRQNHYF